MKITKRLLAALLTVVMILGSLPLSVFAADSGAEAVYDTEIATELSEYVLHQRNYTDNTYVGAKAKVTIYADTAKEGKVPTDTRDVLIYVKNWNGERIGDESDVDIVRSYIEAPASVETGNKFLVIVLDYGYSGGTYAEKSVRGTIENSVGYYRWSCVSRGNPGNTLTKFSLDEKGNVNVNSDATYILPEGYRLERDILFWESDYHSSLGTLNSAGTNPNGSPVNTVVNAWNSDIAKENGSGSDWEYVYYDYYVTGDEIPSWDLAKGATVGSPKYDENGDVILYDPNGDGTPDSHIAPKVSRPEDCVRAYFDAAGNYVVEPLDYSVRLDIIHPAFVEGSEKAVETPVVMVAATQSHRMDNQLDGVRNHLGAFLFGGYTGVVYDYAYVPTARNDHYGYNDMYGTHDYNAAKWSRAAVRCVRYYAETFGYSDDLIGVMGISKGSPTAGTLSANNNEDVLEKSVYPESKNGTLFEGRTEGGVANLYQPYSQYENGYDGEGNDAPNNPAAINSQTGDIDSNVSIAYVASGSGIDWQYQTETNLNKHITTNGTVPMVLSCGANDPYGCYDRWQPLLDYKAKNANAPYLAMQMEDKGHEYPIGIDPIRDFDRYESFYKYFDMYLLPESYAPSVVYITPKSGAEDVAKGSNIEVQLMANCKVDISEVRNNVTITAADGSVVTGNWSTDASKMSNLFTFNPSRLEAGTEYTITVSENLKDSNGNKLEVGKTATFTVENSDTTKFELVGDTYVSKVYADKNYGDSYVLKVNGGENEHIALVNFKYTYADKKQNILNLKLPVLNNSDLKVKISYILDSVDENTVTYNNIKNTRANAVSLGEYQLNNGATSVDVSALIAKLGANGEFTLVVEAANKATNVVNIDFEEYATDSSVPFGSTTTLPELYYTGNDGYIGARGSSSPYSYDLSKSGDSYGFTVKEESNGNKYGVIAARNTRYSILNAFGYDALTQDDVGKVYTLSFKIRKHATQASSVTSAGFSYGVRDMVSTYWLGGEKTFTISDEWQTVTLAYTINGADTGRKPMFTLVFQTDKARYDIDEMIVTADATNCAASLSSSDNTNGKQIEITTDVVSDMAPVADAYVSKIYPDNNFGASSVLMVTGGDDENIALASFSSASLNYVDYLSVNIPVKDNAYVPVEAWLIEDYCIDESAVTYNNIKDKLATKVSLGKYILREGLLNVDLTSKLDALKEHDYFTIVITADNAASHMLNLDFEQYDEGQLLRVAAKGSLTTSPFYTDTFDEFAIRKNQGFISWTAGTPQITDNVKIFEEANGNKYAALKTSSNSDTAASELNFLNTFAHKAIPDDYVGKTFRITARVRVAENFDNGKIEYGVMKYDATATDSSATRVGTWDGIEFTKKDGWVDITTTYTLTEADVAGNMKFVIMLYRVGDYGKCYGIDDIRVVMMDSDVVVNGASITSSENKREASKIRLLALNSDAYDNKPVADAYAVQGDNKSYGDGETLTLTGKVGANSMIFTTFMTSTLEGRNYLKLPSDGICDGQEISVAVIDNVVIDENIFNYRQGQAWVMDFDATKFVGRYTLNKEAPYIDISRIKNLVKGGVFTLVIQADQKHEYKEDFEGDKQLGSSSAVLDNRVYDDTYIYSLGASGSTKREIVAMDKNGDSTNVLHIATGGNRFKFFNSLSYDDITVLDKGREYRASFDFMTDFDSDNKDFYASLKASYSSGNNITTGPSLGGTQFSSNHCSHFNNILKKNDGWNTHAFTIVLNDIPASNQTYTAFEAAVRFQAALLTIDTVSVSGKNYYFDDITVTEVTGNDGVTTSTFASRESGEAMSFITFNGTDVTLDDCITIVSADVSLDSEFDGITDVFFTVGELSYSLLSVDNATGEIFFTKDGSRYDICGANGEKYIVGKDAVTLTAIYDSKNGTVRYTIGDKLGYYLDNGTVKNTYGTKIVENGGSGNALVGAMYDRFGATTTKLTVAKAKCDAPEIVGTQTSVWDNSIRIITGLDMLYYSSIGFIAERPESETLNIRSNRVFRSISADGATVTASDLGFEYLSALVIVGDDNIENMDGKTFTITPIAYIDDVEIQGEPIEYIITNDDGVLRVDEVNPDLSLKKTFTMKAAEGLFNPLGRTAFLNSSLTCDHPASGAEFKAYCRGDVSINFTAQKNNQKLSVYIDGTFSREISLKAGTFNYTVAENLPEGMHTIKIVAQYAHTSSTLNSISLNGVLHQADSRDTYIEFIGDSSFAGYGMSPTNENDATKTLVYTAIESLDVDYSLFAQGGIGIAYSGTEGHTINKKYPYQSNARDTVTPYVPTRTPDLIVFALGQNDDGQWYSKGQNNPDHPVYNYTTFDAAFAEFIGTLDSLYGEKKIPIVFVNGIITVEGRDIGTNRVEYLIENIYVPAGYDMSVCPVTTDRNGFESHSTPEGAKIQGVELAEFIRKNYTSLFE